MPVQIGASAASEGLLGLLLECHQRIRHFVGLAVTISRSEASPEVVQAAAEVRRYFEQALPLHVADEEALLSLLPPTPALDRMSAEHLAHLPLLTKFVALLAAVTPKEVPVGLAPLALKLATDFESHLLAEETQIFPLLATLSEANQADLVRQMRQRRHSP